jgi:hypothetical protein
MNTKGNNYKGYDILISTRRDGTNGFWTGCYRISDGKKKIVFENSILPFDNESDALTVASVKARTWIDGSTAGPGM